jgi:Tfp pilus assembly protein PilO
VRRRWRDRLKVPLLVLVMLNAGVYFSYTMPRSLRERSAAARLQVLRDEVERDRRITEALRGRAETMRSNQADVGRFYARLGPKATLSQVRAEITALARELGLKVGGFTYTPEDVKGGEGVSLLQVHMPVSGTYHELAAFLERLERSSYFVTVDQIQFRKRASGGEADLDLAMTAFYRTPATDATGARAGEETR